MKNPSLLPLIMFDDVSMIKVNFQPGPRSANDTEYSYLIKGAVAVGDYVMVNPRGEWPKVVKVTKINVVPTLSETRTYCYAVKALDPKLLDQLNGESILLQEDHARVQFTHWRAELRATLTVHTLPQAANAYAQ